MSGPSEQFHLEIRERDLQLLRGLFDCRLMTLNHVADIHFTGAAEAAKKRIRKLKEAGYLSERDRKPNEKSLLFLTREGHCLLRDRSMLDDLPPVTWPTLERRFRVSPLTIRHELDVLDIKAAFHRAARSFLQCDVDEFSTWPILHEFVASPKPCVEQTVKPDGFVRLYEQHAETAFEHLFFFELDRSSESLETLVNKAHCYLNFYQSGGLAVRFGHSADQYKDFPFRVLIVLKTAERRNNLAEALLTSSPPIYTHTWLTTFPEAIANPLRRIWARPRDYLNAIDKSPFSLSAHNSHHAYRRQSERERYVESILVKHALLDQAG